MLLKSELITLVLIGLDACLMLVNALVRPKNKAVACLTLCLAGTAFNVGAAETEPGALSLTRWTCSAFYLPARSIWQRTVDIEFDTHAVRAVLIDDVPVYAFNVQGTTVLTAVDGERIQFDPVAQSWTSDLRGIVTSQGSCKR